MDVLFENSHIRDKEGTKDVYGYICFRRPIIIVFYVIFALHILANIYNAIAIDIYYGYYIFFPVIWVALVVFLYNKRVNTTIKRDLELHGKAIEFTLRVTEDMIKLSQSTGSEFQINYRDIKKVVQTRKYIYLWSKTNMLYPFKKDAFTVGNADEFLLFLKNKGMKLK